MKIKNIKFKIREGDISESGACNFSNGKWVDRTTDYYFKDKKVIIFSLPGAFTPTCTSQQLPGYDNLYTKFKEHGIDEVYCISVNDSFVMNAWKTNEQIKNIKMIPDGNGELTKSLDMLVNIEAIGFGYRSWRYAAIVHNGDIIKMFVEPGKEFNDPSDPYGVSSPENVLKYLEA